MNPSIVLLRGSQSRRRSPGSMDCNGRLPSWARFLPFATACSFFACSGDSKGHKPFDPTADMLNQSRPATAAQPAMAPTWGVGLSEPLDLVTHVHVEGRVEPPYCADPSLLLERIHSAIEDGPNSAGEPRCTSNSVTDADGSKLIRMSCPLRSSGSGCQDFYVAQLWAERFEGSTTSYVLRGYGWIRRTCPGGKTYDADELRKAASSAGEAFKDIIRPCRPPLDGQ
jgi:hypothetical protein